MRKFDIIINLTIGILIGMSIGYLISIESKKEQIENDKKFVKKLQNQLNELDSLYKENVNSMDSIFSQKVKTVVEKEVVNPTFLIGDKSITLDELLKISNENSDKVAVYEQQFEYLKEKTGIYFVNEGKTFHINYVENSLIENTKKSLTEKIEEVNKLKNVISSVEDLQKIKITYKEEDGKLIVRVADK